MWLKVAVFTPKCLLNNKVSPSPLDDKWNRCAELRDAFSRNFNKYCTWRASRCLDLSKLRYAFLWICFGMSTFCLSMRQSVSAYVRNCVFNVWIHPISDLQQLLSRCQQNMVYSAIQLISIMIMENLPKAVDVSHQLTFDFFSSIYGTLFEQMFNGWFHFYMISTELSRLLIQSLETQNAIIILMLFYHSQ